MTPSKPSIYVLICQITIMIAIGYVFIPLNAGPLLLMLCGGLGWAILRGGDDLSC